MRVAFFFLLLAPVVLLAQQQPQLTEFMFFKQAINPAYAGHVEGGSISALHRSQWLGIEGAPTSQFVSFHMPLLYQRVGVGLNLSRQSIGVTESWTADGMYAYRFKSGPGEFSIGLQASLRYWGINYQDERLRATQGLTSDGAIPVGNKNRYVPNFGFGLYYSSNKFYFGASAPRLLEADIDFSETALTGGTEVRHLYLMTGVVIPLGGQIDIQPQFLFKYAGNAPLDADFNVMAILMNAHALGLTYRLGGSSIRGFGESLDAILSIQASDQLMIGVSYDIPLSELQESTAGSIEGIVRWSINPPQGTEILSPRYF